ADLGAGGERLAHGVELGQLILRQRLGGKEIQRAARGLAQNWYEDRRVLTERFTRCRWRDDDDVPAAERVVNRFSLMRVEARDAARRERGCQARVQAVGKRRVARVERLQTANGSDIAVWPLGFEVASGAQRGQRRIESSVGLIAAGREPGGGTDPPG